MSATDVSPPSLTPTPSQPRGAAGSSFNAPAWVRVAIACALLIGSAGVRAWQSRRIEGRLEAARLRPKFDLDLLPMDLGRWKGSATRIDEQIARTTGADQIITRRYVNQDTGAAVDLIVLYGPAALVYIHSPELCYPSAGFSQVAGPEDRQVGGGDVPAPFRFLVFSKGEGASADLQEVYYSWWYNGRWSPQVGTQKQFERIPGMFKVHLARRTSQAEVGLARRTSQAGKRDAGNPCDSLLRSLLPEMERRMAAGS